jgi:hypothetical protein
LKRQRLNESLRVRRHCHVDHCAGLMQRAGELDRFERGDAAGYAERNPFASQNGYVVWHGVALRS